MNGGRETMTTSRSLTTKLGAAAVTLLALSAPASAGGLFGRGAEGSIKDAPAAEEGRRCNWSFNVGVASEYVFRGISQSAEDPALQGGADVTCGMFYAGLWASSLDFDAPGAFPETGADAEVEIDYYAGFKPTWGRFNFDFGVIYYSYPGASDRAAELDYVEFKAGYTTSWIDKLTSGTTLFVSPEYSGEVGTTLVVESTLAYELPKVWVFTPTLSALLGSVYGTDDAFDVFFGDDSYYYWNAGLALVVDKLTLDFRYWDSDLDAPTFTTSRFFSAEERFVFTAKVTLP